MDIETPHRFPVCVYYEDTDMGGIVYHANYLRFIERARSRFVRELGIDQNALRESGTVFVVARIEADFRAPAKFEDELLVETRIGILTPARLMMDQQVKRGDLMLFQAKVTAVCMEMATGKATRLPAELRQLM